MARVSSLRYLVRCRMVNQLLIARPESKQPASKLPNGPSAAAARVHGQARNSLLELGKRPVGALVDDLGVICSERKINIELSRAFVSPSLSAVLLLTSELEGLDSARGL
jgi:hypothetical protein